MPSAGLLPPVTRRPQPVFNFTSHRFNLPTANVEQGAVCGGADVAFDPSITIMALVYLAFGVVYTIFGYRCFKSTMFLTGFTFATIIVYLICLQEYLMPMIGNIAVSVCGGLLFGLITMLIQYVGLFMSGFHTGLLLGAGGLAIYDHFLIVYPTTYWFCLVTMLCSAIFFAVVNLYWKKGLTILGTSIYGGALISLTLDYFFEHMEMLKWLWDRIKLEAVEAPPCRLTWLLLAAWPASAVVGLTAQAFLTATGIYHEESISAQKRRLKQQQTRPITREQRAELKQKKYRYLYQVRTAHGDVISQNFVQALQRKAAESVGGGECSTLQSDSTHLTALAPSDLHHHSDDDLHQVRSTLPHNVQREYK